MNRSGTPRYRIAQSSAKLQKKNTRKMSVDITAAPKTPLFDSVFESHQKSM